MKKLLYRIYKKLFKKSTKQTVRNEHVWWKGNFQNWEDALNESTGYDSDEILKKCSSAILLVKNKQYKYERDSFVFDHIQYSKGLLIGLLKVLKEKGKLSVLDFGGSLGSSYYQNKEFLNLKNLEWSIVEQEKFVSYGKNALENEELRFFYNLNECFTERNPNVVILSSVLQYLKNPEEIIKDICDLNLDYLVIDRTSIIDHHINIITIQNTPENIYKASYPCWFFNENWLLNKFSNYEVLLDWYSDFEMINLAINDNQKVNWKGYFLKKL